MHAAGVQFLSRKNATGEERRPVYVLLNDDHLIQREDVERKMRV